MWYAKVCAYGNVSYGSLNGHAYNFFAFYYKAERDRFIEWVDETTHDYADIITSKELRYALSEAGYKTYHGKPFVRPDGVIIPREYDDNFDFELAEMMDQFNEFQNAE